MKYYAVKSGLNTGKFTNWDDCKVNVVGVKGAVYKSFDTEEEADAYLAEGVESHEERSGLTFTNTSLADIDVASDLRERKVHIFVDGSQISEKGKKTNLQPLYGVLILQNNPLFDNSNELIAMIMSGSVKKFKDVVDVTMSNQIAGELYSALRAITWAINAKMNEVTIYYDYMGIEQWATGAWNAKNELGKSYAKQVTELMKHIKVNFVKTKGHNDVLYNEMVDLVAKMGKFLN